MSYDQIQNEVEAEISAEAYFTAQEGVLGAYKIHNDVYQIVRHDDNAIQNPLSLLTICVLVLRNGFTVTGESACASPENFDEEIGREIARQNAVNKIWPLLGFSLRNAIVEAKAKRAPRYRCAETGEYVTQEYAGGNPATTVKES